jgi:hypothetical protein
MTTPEELCREEFTQEQLNKLLDRASWNALLPVAVEMGLGIKALAVLNYDYPRLRDLMRQVWRERGSRLTQCQASYQRARKENDKQRQILMDFHTGGKNQ